MKEAAFAAVMARQSRIVATVFRGSERMKAHQNSRHSTTSANTSAQTT